MSSSLFQLPEGFIKLVAPLLGNGLDAFLATYQSPPKRALRWSSRGPFIALPFLGKPVPWADHAYYVTGDSRPGAHPLHWAGAYYLQEPSAMAPAVALNIRPGDKVLDLCAAPGGKAGQLSAFAGPAGFLLANDPVYKRAVELGRNFERLGVSNAVVTCEPPARLALKLPGFFDKILVDAPCSGEGMFKKEPAALSRWHPGLVTELAQTQEAILHQAALLLKPGGRLVYSTCTFNTIENEGVLTNFMQEHPEFALKPFALPGLPEAQDGFMRLWPHQIAGEGHFLALMVKEGGVAPKATPYPQAAHPILKLINKGLEDWVKEPLRANALHLETAVILPEGCPDLTGLNVLRLGLHAGSLVGKTPRPDHALALGTKARQTFEVDENLAERFRTGEVLPAPATLSGYTAPVFRGWQLGWGKAGQGVLKNHYPRGLRKFSMADET